MTLQIYRILRGHSSSVTSMAFSSDGSKIAGAYFDQIYIWNLLPVFYESFV
jgi:WD40 repeat protein